MELLKGLPLPMKDEEGNSYSSITVLAEILHVDRKRLSNNIKRTGVFMHNGHTYTVDTRPLREDAPSQDHVPGMRQTQANASSVSTKQERDEDAEYQAFKAAQSIMSQPFTKIDFKFSKKGDDGHRMAVALFSDAHIEETVKPSTVLGLNEYNIDIAEKRIEAYFVNLVNCLNEDKVDDLIFASLGDTISGFIHEELAQENGQTPLEATLLAQNLIGSGLEYICEHSNVKSIKFIGIVGNHSRVTKKIQHANGYKLSYEWLVYKNVEKWAKASKLPVEFYLPESEVAVVEAEGHKFVFAHGFQIKGSGTGTVCGIYPALNRLCMKWERVFHQDHVFIGHFHSCISIPNATVNGSIIGYNSFALSNGMSYEEPAQCYVVYDSIIGELLTRKIYCK